MRKLKAGIVGCGGIANGKHLPAMKKSGLYEIVAFCDIIRERAEKAKGEYGTEDAKVFEDYQELIKEDLDVVYVTTPNRSHAEISIAAMEAGKDVMCEKPMAKNYAEAQKMVETSEKTGRILNIGYQNRYRPDSLYLKEMCKADELGEIYFAKAHALRRRAVPTWGVFLNEEEQSFTIDNEHLSYQITIKNVPQTCENGGKGEDECSVEVPNTGSNKTLLYLLGITIISAGVGYVYKYNKAN